MSISYLASYTFNTSSLCLFLYLSLSFYIYLTIVSVEVNISIYWYRQLKDSWLWLDNKIDRKIDDTAMQFLLVQNTWLNPDWIRANGLCIQEWSVCFYINLFVFISICLFLYLSVCFYTYHFVFKSISLFLYLCLCFYRT